MPAEDRPEPRRPGRGGNAVEIVAQKRMGEQCGPRIPAHSGRGRIGRRYLG